MRRRVKTKLKRRRDDDGAVTDLKDTLEADPLAANLAAPHRLAGLADLIQ